MGLAIALALRRVRGLRRVCWHRLSGRWPRYRWRVKGRRDVAAVRHITIRPLTKDHP